MARRPGRLVAAVILGVLVLSPIFAYTTGWWAWTSHPSMDPAASAPPRTPQPAAPVASSTPRTMPTTGKAASDHSVASGENTRLVDAYLFFLAALSSHRARGAMNTSGGLGRDAHPASPTPPGEP